MAMLEGIKIRRYEKNDSLAVLRLENECMKPEEVEIRAAQPKNPLKDIEGDFLANGEFLVASKGGKIIAIGAMRRQGEAAEIAKIRVHPDFRRKSIGQEMLLRLEKKAAEIGCKKIILDTAIGHLAAQKMYDKNGYKEYGRGESEGFYCILYEKSI
ncbi:hypothetical protein COU37_03475 [Candidatus Micrarchaeota archaeon CG10_big_fil_rev_8_21_14_0_10_45_29]|nr:MAG: hypothetical protein COU37_03475 [Candidatus Micrarchaeota archaeon CG10_big_fil_rev_8_21_14_0_10_45_29]